MTTSLYVYSSKRAAELTKKPLLLHALAAGVLINLLVQISFELSRINDDSADAAGVHENRDIANVVSALPGHLHEPFVGGILISRGIHAKESLGLQRLSLHPKLRENKTEK
jgi:hypothetical protein